MSDFYEIDFLDVESPKSGDAIALRYKVGEVTTIHVVDGGFQDTGAKLADFIRKYYGNPAHIDRVVASHPDGDHAGGLRVILEEFSIGELWMLRPWLYAGEILDQFKNFSSVENLQRRLREVYPNIAALEEIAEEKHIPIYAPFQGAAIGAFIVMAPTRARYLNLILESERTPESIREAQESAPDLGKILERALAKAVAFVKAAWGEEVFSPEETSAENEMSVIQYANLCEEKILLTADTGRAGLAEAASYAPHVGLALPGINRFQVPHHGSRRNVSSETLDLWLGPKLPNKLGDGESKFTAIISSAKADKDHPRKSVVRACIHRGAKVVSTEGADLQIFRNAPARGWSAAKPMSYPEDQEV